jgi:hypothetical protein
VTDDPFAETAEDQLTPREVMVYKVIHGVAVVLVVFGFLWYLVFKVSPVGLVHALVFSAISGVVIVFGLALRNKVRVVHGIQWLRRT